MKQITFSMNKLDPKSQDTSEALGARGAARRGISHAENRMCVDRSPPLPLFAFPPRACLPVRLPPPFSVTKSSQSPAICPEGAIVNEHKFDGVTSCTTSIRPSVAFSDRGGARQSETVKGRAALHRNHHSHLLIEEGKADGRRRLNRLHAACFAGSYDYTGPKTSFWPD